MPDTEQSPTAPPGCAPTNSSEVPTPRTNAASLTIEAGDWVSEKDCTNYALNLAAQLEMEAVTLGESHRTLIYEAMEMSDELEWAKQTASDALRERDEARTRAKDYFDALELAAKERDEWRDCAMGLEEHVSPHNDDCPVLINSPKSQRRKAAVCNCSEGRWLAEFERLKKRDAGLPNE